MNALKNFFTPAVRRWLYGIAIAFVPLAVYLGWIRPEASPVILPLVLAILHVSPKYDDASPEDVDDE